MRLPRAGHQEFIRLRIAIEAKQQVFFHQLVQRRSQLVFVRAGLRLDRVSHRRLRNRDRVDQDFVPLRAQRVAGQRDAQLGDRAEITRMQLRYFDQLPSLHDREVRQSLVVAAM